tara:strand:+ start:35173 stop:36135 length:963 start_codon:yes stop_codon:yes gene_type:complete
MRVSPGLGIPVARTPQALETPMLLDRDGMPTATLAYSLRKLREDYTGKAVRVRRASDSVEVDVDFDDENKVSGSSVITVTSGSYSGTMTLAAFSSGTTIHVTTWWDQVGTAQSAFQTTAGSQPVLASDYSTLEFSASYNNYLQTTHVPAEGGDGTDVGDSNTWMTVSKYIDTDNDRHELVSALYYYPAYGRSLYVEGDTYRFDVGGGGGNTDIDTLDSTVTASTSNIEVVIASYMPAESGNEMKMKVNGTDRSPASSSHNVNSFNYGHFHIGYCNYPYFTTDKWDGKIYEVVAWENTAAFAASSATAGTVWEDAEDYYDL